MPDLANDSQGLHVLGVSGSLHENSRSALVLELFLRHAAERGAQTRLLDLRAVELPLYRPHREPPSAAEERMSRTCFGRESVVLASPDYHGSMSGAMKNFLDYNWEECAGKTFRLHLLVARKRSDGDGSNAHGSAPVLWLEHALRRLVHGQRRSRRRWA